MSSLPIVSLPVISLPVLGPTPRIQSLLIKPDAGRSGLPLTRAAWYPE